MAASVRETLVKVRLGMRFPYYRNNIPRLRKGPEMPNPTATALHGRGVLDIDTGE